MKRPALTACLILSAAVGAMSLNAAQAGGAINKCVDSAGRITLTDQACDASTVSSSIAVPGSDDDNAGSAGSTPVVTSQRVLPLRQVRWAPPTPARAPLSGDMATMKQARIQMMLQDAAPRARLASR
jgi:hypothetical protein